MDYYDIHTAGTKASNIVKHVEGAHLKREMLAMTRDAGIAADLNYTLNKFPNHPAALDLVSRLDQAKRKGYRQQGNGMAEPVDCYFHKALIVDDKQPETYVIWAMHYLRNDKLKLAKEKFEAAEKLGADDANFHYNYGLYYVSTRDYDNAFAQAKLAYARGYPLPGLMNQLEKKGYKFN